MPDESPNTDAGGPDAASPTGVPHPASTVDQAGDRGGGLTEAAAVPIPPRFWWLKRLGPVAIAFLLLLVGVRLWWGHVAETRLQAKIAEYRAAGQPVLLEDFVPDPIPDEENGAHFLMLAAAKIPNLPEVGDVPLDAGDFIWDLRHDRQHLETVRQFVQSNAEALRLVHEARSKTATDWKLNWSSPAITMLLPSLSGARTLTKTVNLVAVHHHVTGNDAEAVESLRDALAIGRRVSAQPGGGLISHFVRVSIEALTALGVEAVSGDLGVSLGATSKSPSAAPATRAQVQALIQDLLNETEFTEAWAYCFYTERMAQVDTIQFLVQAQSGFSALMIGGPAPASPAERVAMLSLGPAWKLDAIRAMKYYTDYAKVAAAPNWPAAAAAVPPLPEPGSLPEKTAAAWSRIMLPNLDGAGRQHYAALAHRRFAATALALRLYEIDHGQRPQSLAELVPDYLPAVPLDPFDADNGELRYLPDAPSPLLYSVSTNGIDEGGVHGLKDDGRVDLYAHDLPFFLNADRPQREPYWHAASTQAVEDDE